MKRLPRLDTSLTQVRKRKSEEVRWREEVTGLILGGFHCTCSNSILRKFCWVFSFVVSLDRSLCSCVVVLVFLSVILLHMVMML